VAPQGGVERPSNAELQKRYEGWRQTEDARGDIEVCNDSHDLLHTGYCGGYLDALAPLPTPAADYMLIPRSTLNQLQEAVDALPAAGLPDEDVAVVRQLREALYNINNGARFNVAEVDANIAAADRFLAKGA